MKGSALCQVDHLEEVEAQGRGELGQEVRRVQQGERVRLLVRVQLVERGQLQVEQPIVDAQRHVEEEQDRERVGQQLPYW